MKINTGRIFIQDNLRQKTSIVRQQTKYQLTPLQHQAPYIKQTHPTACTLRGIKVNKQPNKNKTTETSGHLNTPY